MCMYNCQACMNYIKSNNTCGALKNTVCGEQVKCNFFKTPAQNLAENFDAYYKLKASKKTNPCIKLFIEYMEEHYTV